ncbi:hypothetical protein SK854_01680 [Lentzea sp. BCCO 10_0061]|uniref:Uncharacterized protein n=1 Tax=Lentzea sokolovensis TaxID=3095429 RepID=A0ABU4UMS9_9PSEU|nr:hypothetical protein [Lentzea sp. BCCO 10_0061]MDX8140803.1 hypothetical protein [Lentzea sp. BCCO 10_0061]
MELEIVVRPRDEDVGSKLDEAPGWPDYARELREVFRVAVEASGAGALEVSGLMVHEPLPDRLSWLREGISIAAAEVADLYTETVGRGSSPLFCLASDVLRIELCWDGWVFLPTTQEVYDALDDLPEEHLEIGWRPSRPDPEPDGVVEFSADEDFWAQVRLAARHKTTLLGERWASGTCGTRWFLLSPENVDDVIAAVEPGSLISVAVDPDLRVRLVDRSFTAFTAPLGPGELVYREVWFGVDDDAELAEVTGAGFDLFLSDAALAELYAVVPDADGVARRRWDDPKQVL